ncbi:hypothetical protein AMEX_G20064 [Astyanax mexicanus]|uniref:Uncharacterized protein n=1 Tax=Astyanax mexicanus TaxID=7994 RepID=A0A8T2L3F1_ASTMX|nr:hypothetical protein AMEX_G20064 [Astyanax mexicanus]
MATQKQQRTKQLRPPSRIGRDLRAALLHLKNGQRTKHPQAFPQRGELPSAAGLLLYPDKKEKMVTTTEIAFGPKTCTKTEPIKILQCNLVLEGDRTFVTTHREAFQAQPQDDGAPLMVKTASGRAERTPTPHFQTNYQKNFPQPRGIYKRRLQVLPCPDNLAVNPALRQEAEFRTVQRETYPEWSISLDSLPVAAQLKEQLTLKNETARPSAATTRKVCRNV